MLVSVWNFLAVFCNGQFRKKMSTSNHQVKLDELNLTEKINGKANVNQDDDFLTDELLMYFNYLNSAIVLDLQYRVKLNNVSKSFS